MDPNQPSQYQYPGEQEATRAHFFQVWKERIYRFFYNIWPAVYNVITFFVYHTFRVIRGGIRIAMEQFRQGG